MSKFKNKPNLDDRSDNVEKIQKLIHRTEENIHQAEISLEFTEPHQHEQIKAKNQRRKEAIQGFKEEI